ncbi:MAG: hypothetical protein ABWY47_13480 [Xanthobacteraceae bacterium]|jgi:hypothetical protein
MATAPAASRARVWWFAAMALGGFGFGLLGDRRPFGTDVLTHPFVVFFAVVAVALLVLRVACARPVPELIPERALLAGCLLGGAAFLAGNWAAAHLLAVR